MWVRLPPRTPTFFDEEYLVTCVSRGIGRLAWLRTRSGNTKCGFESHLAHQFFIGILDSNGKARTSNTDYGATPRVEV